MIVLGPGSRQRSEGIKIIDRVRYLGFGLGSRQIIGRAGTHRHLAP